MENNGFCVTVVLFRQNVSPLADIYRDVKLTQSTTTRGENFSAEMYPIKTLASIEAKNYIYSFSKSSTFQLV